MAFLKNAGRQYPIVAVQQVDYTSTAEDAVTLPVGARVLGVNFYTDVAWNSATSAAISVGDAGSATRYINAQDIKTLGSETAVQAVGYSYPSGGQIKVAVANVGAPTAGSGTLIVQYVIDGRANDVQA